MLKPGLQRVREQGPGKMDEKRLRPERARRKRRRQLHVYRSFEGKFCLKTFFVMLRLIANVPVSSSCRALSGRRGIPSRTWGSLRSPQALTLRAFSPCACSTETARNRQNLLDPFGMDTSKRHKCRAPATRKPRRTKRNCKPCCVR